MIAVLFFMSSCAKDDLMAQQVPTTFERVFVGESQQQLINIANSMTDDKSAYEDANGDYLADLRYFSYPANLGRPFRGNDFVRSYYLLMVTPCNAQGQPIKDARGNPYSTWVAVRDIRNVRPGLNTVFQSSTWYSNQVNFNTGQINYNPNSGTNYVLN